MTYQGNFECDHCFVNSCPETKGVMRISDIPHILEEAKSTGTIGWIYFEGGEPFLYYQTMLWGMRAARDDGFKRGIVTNAYWATSKEDAKEWLTPIAETDISDFSISDDVYHYDASEENLAQHAYEAARDLGLPVSKITIENLKKCLKEIKWKGRPVVEGRVLFKGRAAEKLVMGIPRKPWTEFDKCLGEDFSNQIRVHIDPLGYVHVYQDITIGNMKKTPLTKLFKNFIPEKHPICAPILKGGPAEIVKEYHIEHEESYVDECHLCYCARSDLRKKFPEILALGQIYTP
jgi:MoaA/NifB/PqqE/SkfB family radical SAM enzyme